MAFSSLRVMQGVSGGVGLPTKSLVFDRSSSQYLSISNSGWGGSYTVGKKTISLWFKRASIGTQQVLYGRAETTSAREFYIQLDNSNVISVDIYNSSINTGNYTTSTTITDTSSWHHLMVTYDASQASASRIKVYIDGIEDGQSTTGTANTTQVGASTQAGFVNYLSGQYFDGKLYQATYFDNRVVPIAEVYDSGSPKNLINSAGIYSMLNCDNDSAVKDLRLSDWTNNNGVTLSTDIPT